jgi:soluble lytic murein transglycosylase-like protein
MHRRHATRRLTTTGLIASAFVVAAFSLRPNRSSVARAAATVVTASANPNATPSAATPSAVTLSAAGARVPYAHAPLAAAKSSSPFSLPFQPAWKPAGDVLKRKGPPTTASATLPFGIDPAEVERKESLGRWHRIYTYSTQYRIKPDLARRIYDAAVNAGIEPELGFRLVRVESVFDPKAASPVGAIGLTQLMLGTAREFQANVTREQLLDPDTNLRIGFTYLRALIREYKGNLKIALLVYNRGPAAVQTALSLGQDPANGYESMIMRGYRGRGVLD